MRAVSAGVLRMFACNTLRESCGPWPKAKRGKSPFFMCGNSGYDD